MSQSTAISFANPIHGINATRVIQALVKKGRTLNTLRERPSVRFQKDELERLSQFKQPEKAITNQFANKVVELALSGNKIALAMFRLAQLKIQGVTGTIYRDKPAVIDLELLGMYYHNSGNIEAKAIRYNPDIVVKPEDLKLGVDKMPLAFRWGVTRGQDDKFLCEFDKLKYAPNEDFTKWLVSTPVLFADIPAIAKPEEIEKPVEIDGLVFKGQDGGKKLEVSAVSSFTHRKEITVPFLAKENEEIKLMKLSIEHKKR